MELWQAYDRLCEVVLRAEAAFSTLQLSRARCPEQLELVVVFEQANAVATALADFLDSVDRKLARAANAGAPSPACVEEVWDFLREIEALRDEETAGRLPLARGVAIKLHRFYGFHVELDNHLARHRIPRTFAWQENMKLWQTLVYDGGIAYLCMIPRELELHDRIRRRAGSEPADAAGAADDLRGGRVTSFRCEQGFGVITLDDGRDVQFDAANCTMVPEPGEAVRLRVGPARDGGLKALHVEPRSVPLAPAPTVARVPMPWRNGAIAALRWMAQHGEFLSTAEHAALLDHERRVWCEEIDDLLRSEWRSASSLDAEVSALLDRVPPPDAAINQRLAMLTDLGRLGEEQRGKARSKIRWTDF